MKEASLCTETPLLLAILDDRLWDLGVLDMDMLGGVLAAFIRLLCELECLRVYGGGFMLPRMAIFPLDLALLCP